VRESLITTVRAVGPVFLFLAVESILTHQNPSARSGNTG
jgi:hypothetical protein